MVAHGSTTAFTGGNGTSISGVSKPTGTSVGDVLIAQMSIENAGDAPTISSTGDTWNPVHSINNTTPTPDLYLYVWICVVQNASSTIGVTWGGGSYWRDFAVHRFTGVHTTTPQDATATENVGTSTTVTATGLTTSSDNAHLVMCTATLNGQTHASWSSPLTERNDSEQVAMASGDQASAGASGNMTATITSDSWAAILLALKPDGAASAPTVVGAGTPSFTATNGATLAPGLPSGWAENDIHVMIAARSDNTAMTTLDGWTSLSAGNNTAGQRVEVWARRAVSGDSGPTVTFGSGTTVRGARIIGVRGVPTSTALADLPISRSDNAASATITFATLTPPQATNRLLALYAYEDDPTAASQITNWSTFTVSTSSLGSDMALGYADREWASANSATGGLTSTASGGSFANSPNVGILLALSALVGAVTGTGAVTIQEPSLSATGTHTPPAVTGTGALTINEPALSSTGTFTTTGSGALTINEPSLSASGQVAHNAGSGALTIQEPSLSATGTFTTTGTGSVTISEPALAASGTMTTTGAGSVNIGKPALAATGTMTTTGTGALTINEPALSGSGTSSAPGAGGTGGVTIDGPSLAASGTFTTTGAGGVAIDAPALQSTGTFSTTGAGALTIQEPSLSGAGTFAPAGTGSGAVTIGRPALAAAGTMTTTGSGAVTINEPDLSGSGTFTSTGQGSGALTIGAPQLSGAGAFTTTGSGAFTIGRPVLTASGQVIAPVTGTGAMTIGPPQLSGFSILASVAVGSDAAYGGALGADAAVGGTIGADVLVGAAVGSDTEG